MKVPKVRNIHNNTCILYLYVHYCYYIPFSQSKVFGFPKLAVPFARTEFHSVGPRQSDLISYHVRQRKSQKGTV